MRASAPNLMRILFNGGDNMLGRAVQLTFPIQSPNESALRDSCTAQHYLDMALHPTTDGKSQSLDEIRRDNLRGNYLWGDYRTLLLNPPPDIRIMNLETALTRSIDNDDVPWEKGINYHCHLDNFEGVMEGYETVCNANIETKGGHGTVTIDNNCHPSPVCIALANNHIMDFGRQAFSEETLPFIKDYTQRHHSSTQFVGAGSNIEEASRPAHWTLNLSSSTEDKTKLKVYVIGAGSMDSGVPHQWGATPDSAGVFWLPRLDCMEAVYDAIELLKYWMNIHAIGTVSRHELNSVIILSIHWGPNWAYRYSGDNQKFRREFAHKCIDECGVDLIYGHSSHHIRGLEKHNGKLIIYGAGDLINDYEGFSNAGDEKYCEYGALFIADISVETKELHQLTLVPTVMSRLQLKLLCPSSQPHRDIWNPRTRTNERRSNFENASLLCNRTNQLSDVDAEKGQGINLRVSRDSNCFDSEVVLVYP